jgi:hypothetical protein
MTKAPSQDRDLTSVGSCSWSRGDRLALVAIIVLAFGSLFWLVHPWYDPVTDASVYLLSARAMAAGEGYAYLGEPFYLRAPGVSALVSPFVSATEIDFHAVNLLTSTFGAACVVLFFLFQRPRLGWPLALACALLLWSLPGFHRLGNQTLSDVPGASLLLGCLIVERWSARSSSLSRQLLLGICIGVSTYVRAGLVLLLPAIFLGRLVQRWSRRGTEEAEAPSLLPATFAFIGAAMLVMAPWAVRNAGLERSLEPVDQTLQYDQSTLILHERYADPSSPLNSPDVYPARMQARAGEVLSALGNLKFVKDGRRDSAGALTYAIGGILLGCLLLAFLRRREPGEFFIGGSLLAISVFPTPFLDRYALPVFLFALPAFLELFRGALRRLGGRRFATPATLVLTVALALLAFAPREGWGEIETAHRSRVESSAALRERLPPDSLLAAPRGWHHLSLFLNRPVYSLLFAVRDKGPAAGLESILDSYGVNTVVITAPSPVGDTLDAMLSRMGAPRVKVPGSPEPWQVIRVRP